MNCRLRFGERFRWNGFDMEPYFRLAACIQPDHRRAPSTVLKHGARANWWNMQWYLLNSELFRIILFGKYHQLFGRQTLLRIEAWDIHRQKL